MKWKKIIPTPYSNHREEEKTKKDLRVTTNARLKLVL